MENGMPRIRNFYKVSDYLACSGQPSEDQLIGMAEEKYEVVINLGLLGQPYSLENEAKSVRKLGIVYHHLPVEFEAPSLDDLKEFVQLMRQYEGRKIWVHCAANYRAISFVALFLYSNETLAEAQVTSLVAEIWSPNPTWAFFIEEALEKQGWK
jgi:protein tyrosine phosphatase (PTP) superfamily phosphohydrolase (DUF442 family)